MLSFDSSANALTQQIEAALREFTAGADPFDDIAMLVITRAETPE